MDGRVRSPGRCSLEERGDKEQEEQGNSLHNRRSGVSHKEASGHGHSGSPIDLRFKDRSKKNIFEVVSLLSRRRDMVSMGRSHGGRNTTAPEVTPGQKRTNTAAAPFG